MKPQPDSEFDQYAENYTELVREPSRDWFGDPNFMHVRKADILTRLLESMGRDPGQTDWLDVGCGQGDLLAIGKPRFRQVFGCDISRGMLESCRDMEWRVQPDPWTIPYETASMDLVTAVCVYHHVMPEDRLRLTTDIRRVLRPGGVFAIIEHNPRNPFTRFVVSRSPVDVNAILLREQEARSLQEAAGFAPAEPLYFLYVPSLLFRPLGFVERMLKRIPLGGQYCQVAVVPV
jgi:SAM-dependent methyltransferase